MKGLTQHTDTLGKHKDTVMIVGDTWLIAYTTKDNAKINETNFRLDSRLTERLIIIFKYRPF